MYIFANWKMNPVSLNEAKELTDEIAKGLADFAWQEKTKVILVPPFVWLKSVQEQLSTYDLGISLGAQNVFWQKSGAYTGEISIPMIKDLGCKYVLVGHSEREIYLRENPKMMKKKLKAVVENDLIPVLCLHPQNENNLKNILENLLADLTEKQIRKIFYLYEPTEAISTQEGKQPSKAKIKSMTSIIKQRTFPDVKILYGGSIKADNILNFTKEIDLDGGLIGSESLRTDNFIAIIKTVSQSC